MSSQPFDPAKLVREARAIRRTFLGMHYRAKAGHIGTGLSAIDVLAYLHGHLLGEADRFILSKGHGASALYATLHHYGKISDAELATYYTDGTLLPAHPAPLGHPAIVAATGSLGHGLPIACGLAYSERLLSKRNALVTCLLSDGECNEGSVWEAALFAARHGLGNLVAIVDANGLQGFGRTTEVLGLEPLPEKWKAFGFDVHEVNGHDFQQIQHALETRDQTKPCAIVARTVKGKGVAFMEDKLEWHYLPMSEAQYQDALRGLGGEEER